MLLSSTPRYLWLGIALLLAALVPDPAHALFPCNGPGPGQYLVGMDNSTTPPTPLCEYDPNYVDPGPSGYWVERFAALAWGRDSRDGPTYTWYLNASSMAEAENGAMAQCRASGFSNCHVGPGVANGALAVAVANDGGLYAEWGANAGQAKRKVLRLCRKSAKGCTVEQVLEAPAVWVSY